MSKKLGGIIVPIITPFQNSFDYKIDGEDLVKLTEYLINQKVSGIFFLGMCGEFLYLSEKRKKEVIDIASLFSNRTTTLVGTTSCSLEETLKLTEYANKKDIKYVVIMPLYFNLTNKDVVKNVYEIKKKSDAKIILYNNPHLTKINISKNSLEEMLEFCYGLKDSSCNDIVFNKYLNTIKKLNEKGKERFILQGDENNMMWSYCNGFVPAGANIVPNLFVNFFNIKKEGDIKEARKIYGFIKEIRKVYIKDGLDFVPFYIKRFLKKQGLIKRYISFRIPKKSDRILENEICGIYEIVNYI